MKKRTLLLACALLAGCSAEPELQKQTFTIELGKDIYGNPNLYLKDPENYNTDTMSVVCLDPSVSKKDNRFVSVNKDYLVVGTYDFEIISQAGTVEFKIKIKDTQPPSLSNAPDSVTVKQGTQINWDDVFHAADLSGVYYETDMSDITSTLGSKLVEVRIYDKYGNSATKEITVEVE